VLIYINPFLATDEGHNELFSEAKEKGYLVEHTDGTPYLIRNSSFSVGMTDLSSPDARTWLKNIMKTEMIGTAGAGGWMNDFGEALPFDAKLHDGADSAVWHNRYAEEWQRVNREAIEESARGDEMVFFCRSGFTRSPGISTLFWLGDQLMTWDEYDGIKTALVGILSSGVSGFSLMHSDTGGYVNFKIEIAGRVIPVINRTPELLMRWMELNASLSSCAQWKAPRPISRRSSTPVPKRSPTWRDAEKSTRAWRSTGRGWSQRRRRQDIRWCATSFCTTRTIPTRTIFATSFCSGRT
jgi:alpha-glucosidase